MGVSTNILNILSNGKFETAVMEHKPEFTERHISDERIRHMHGVAELMYQYYDAFHCKYLSKEEIYVLGLNHDIGYINGKSDHEFYGADVFARFCEFGPQNIIAKCIFHHGDTPKIYMERHMCSEEAIPAELILLWWADMSVESGGEHAGEVVGFQRRLDGLKERYGENSEPYQMCKETMEWLTDWMSRDFLTR